MHHLRNDRQWRPGTHKTAQPVGPDAGRATPSRRPTGQASCRQPAKLIVAAQPGERLAAEAALERVRERLAELGRQDPSIEMQFSMPDQWSRHLFLALCRRYGMKPYRYYRQRRNTVVVRAPKRFLDQVLWPEFSELDQALQAYLHQVTLRVIREEVYADASEAQEIAEALPPN